MPVTLSYPGVYIEEVPSGVRTIAGVATSITAFVGRALRGPVNQAVRVHCASTGAVLYDLADMEAYDPSGVAQTFLSAGQTYQKLYDGYTDDGGDLNVTGRQRVATGWYAVAAVLARHPIFWSGFDQGTTAGWVVQTP